MKKTGKKEKKNESEVRVIPYVLPYNIYLQYIKLKIQ